MFKGNLIVTSAATQRPKIVCVKVKRERCTGQAKYNQYRQVLKENIYKVAAYKTLARIIIEH